MNYNHAVSHVLQRVPMRRIDWPKGTMLVGDDLWAGKPVDERGPRNEAMRLKVGRKFLAWEPTEEDRQAVDWKAVKGRR